MKFEEYLQVNKDKLQHQVDSNRMWNNMQNDPQPKIALKYIFIGITILAIIISAIIMINIHENKRQPSNTEHELIALKSKMNDLISDTKTSIRILAVNMPSEQNVIDHEVISVLIDRMKNDMSPNVQLAATRALADHLIYENVRIAMIETLSTTKDKYLQLKIIDLLTHKKERKLLPYLDSISNMKNRNSILIGPAQRAGKILQEIKKNGWRHQ